MNCLGNINLLELPKVAFFSSRDVHPDAVMACHAWAAEMRDAGRCVMSAFHSPLETDVLSFLLRGESPIVAVLDRKPYKTVPPEWRDAVGKGRMALVSIVEGQERRSAATSLKASNWMLENATEAVFGSVSPGGLTDTVYQKALAMKLACKMLGALGGDSGEVGRGEVNSGE